MIDLRVKGIDRVKDVIIGDSVTARPCRQTEVDRVSGLARLKGIG